MTSIGIFPFIKRLYYLYRFFEGALRGLYAPLNSAFCLFYARMAIIGHINSALLL